MFVGLDFYFSVKADLSDSSDYSGIHPKFLSLLDEGTFASTGQLRVNSCFAGRNTGSFLRLFSNQIFKDGAVVHATENANQLVQNVEIIKELYPNKRDREAVLYDPKFFAYKRFDTR